MNDLVTSMVSADEELADGDVASTAAAAYALRSDADYAPLMEAIGDSQFVLLGESTHGTAEYYAHRAAITKRLVETKGFSVVLIEGDWPAAYRVSRYISSEGSMDRSAHEALAGFAGFPSWMWKNERFASLVEELRAHNERVRAEGTEATATLSALGDLRAAGASEEQLEVMGFTKAAIAAASEGRPEVVLYGMDTYSVNASARAVIEFLEIVDPDAAALTRSRYAVFEPFGDDMKEYGRQVTCGELASRAEEIKADVASVLTELQQNARASYSLLLGPAELLNAEQNAQVVVNGEAYFRGLYESIGSVDTWNLRDQAMVQTCLRLVEYCRAMNGGATPKIVLWAHNSHVGDASATSMAVREEWNLGQMLRQTFGADCNADSGGVFLCGFGTYAGTVTAAEEWGRPPQTFELADAEPGSISDLMHKVLRVVSERERLEGGAPALSAAPLNALLLVLKGVSTSDPEHNEVQQAARAVLREPRRQRAVGVCYRKATEASSHYVEASLATQFDAWIHVDRTTALTPACDLSR